MTDVTENTIQELKKVRQLLEKGWCKGSFARDASGTPVSPQNDSSCQWCLSGAIHRVCGIPEYIPTECQMFDRIAAALSDTLNPSHVANKTLPAFNDAQDSVEPVLELIDKTIERLEKEVSP